MLRAIELASLARGRTSPNPMVGAVMVREGRIVGEGYHLRAGEDHAEVRAIRVSGAGARGADLYVNLEPCSHHGRTPPCTEAIIRAGVKRVFAAIRDPNPLVGGRGAGNLRKAGVEVRFGLASREARVLNEAYLKYIRTGMPFVVIKSAQSLDGKIATRTGDSRWISGEASRKLVHLMRDSADAIMVGIGTVIADNPRLTARLDGRRGKHPVPVVVDPLLRLPLGARVLRRRGRPGAIVVASDRAEAERRKALESLGAEVIVVEGEGGRIDMASLMRRLAERGLTSVLIEGGGETSASALEAGVVDKLALFVSPRIIGGRGAPTSVGGEGVARVRDARQLSGVTVTPVGDDLLIEGYFLQGKGKKCSPASSRK